MSNYIISGIQQVGIGVANVHEGFNWYNRMFGMDIPIFEEAAEANSMLPYTGGQPHKRHAILAINMKGGGGFEIWQYTSRVPQAAKFKAQLGDLGLFCAKIKTDNVNASYSELRARGVKLLGDISSNPQGKIIAAFAPGKTGHPSVPSATEEFFGLVENADNRTSIAVTLRGMNQNGQTTCEHTLTMPAQP